MGRSQRPISYPVVNFIPTAILALCNYFNTRLCSLLFCKIVMGMKLKGCFPHVMQSSCFTPMPRTRQLRLITTNPVSSCIVGRPRYGSTTPRIDNISVEYSTSVEQRHNARIVSLRGVDCSAETDSGEQDLIHCADVELEFCSTTGLLLCAQSLCSISQLAQPFNTFWSRCNRCRGNSSYPICGLPEMERRYFSRSTSFSISI